MRVDFNTAKQNSFGMALNMNEAKIERKIGKAMADAARKARPELEELARDCDIYVRPKKGFWDSWNDCFAIWIKKGHKIRRTESLIRGLDTEITELKKLLIEAAKRGKSAF